MNKQVSNFELCVRIISSLNSNEQKGFENFIFAFTTKGKSGKAYKLFKVICKKPSIQSNEAWQRISKAGKSAQSQVVNSLKILLIDFVSTTSFLSSKQETSHLSERMDAMKHFIAANRFISDSRLSLELMRRSSKLSSMQELHDLHVASLQWYACESSVRSQSRLSDFRDELSELKAKRDLSSYVYLKYFEYYDEVNYMSLKNDRVAMLMEAISYVQSQPLEHQTTTSNFFLMLLQMEYYSVIDENESCIDVGLELIDLISSSKSINNIQIAGVYIDLIDRCCHDANFDLGLQYYEEGLKYAKANSHQEYVLFEYGLICNMSLSRLHESELSVKKMYASAILEELPYYKDKLIYFSCYLQFITGSPKLAMKALLNIKELEHDLTGWNFGLRLLGLQLAVELNLDSLYDDKLESLRKFIERVNGTKFFRSRDLLIYQVLKKLQKNSFDFDDAYSESLSLLNDLQSIHKWEPRTHELLRFEKWFIEKVSSNLIEECTKAVIKKQK